MLNVYIKNFLLSFLSVFSVFNIYGQQVLTMKQAEATALANYGAIKAKADQVNSSKAYLTETKTEYLPDVSVSAQQAYGTANGINGPAYGNQLAVASSGPATAGQNWNAAFGSLYLANVNWNFFAFGRAVEKVKVQQAVVNENQSDLQQEQFEHEIRVATTYLNLLAAQQLSKAQLDNLNRSLDVQKVVIARVKNGLNPGVDSSLANAGVSNAKIALTNAQQTEAEQSNLLAQYLGVMPQNFVLDSVFIKKAPPVADPAPTVAPENHPVLKYYRNIIGVSDEQVKYLSTFSYPTFTMFGVYQGKGSGFKSDISANPNDFNSSYGAGADPTRYNYLLGIGVTWDLTNPFRVHYQVRAQKYTSQEYRDEYNLVDQQLRDQQALAEIRISNSIKNYNEAPIEVKASNDAYVQKFALYKNGLANIIDFTTALYTLNRAEVDQYIASNNVWQALLYKAAATGDFGIFINNF